MKNRIYTCLLLSSIHAHGALTVQINLGLSSGITHAEGKLMLNGDEKGLYKAMFDGQYIKTSLLDLPIVPHTSLYFAVPNQGTLWEDTTDAVYLIETNTTDSTTHLKIAHPGLVTPSEGATTAAIVLDAPNDQLSVTYTNATIEIEDEDILPTYSVVKTDYTSNGMSNHLVTLIDTELAENTSKTVNSLTTASSPQTSHLKRKVSEQGYAGLSSAVLLKYSHDGIQSLLKASFNMPITETSSSSLSTIVFSPSYIFGIALGVGIESMKNTTVNLLAGVSFISGELTSTLPKYKSASVHNTGSPNNRIDLSNETILNITGGNDPQISYRLTNGDMRNSCYPELSDYALNEYLFFVELQADKIFTHNDFGLSAYVRYSFDRQPDDQSLEKFLLGEIAFGIEGSFVS